MSATTYKRKARPDRWIMDSKFKRAYCATSERYTAFVAEQDAQRKLSQESEARTPEQEAASDKFCADNFGSCDHLQGNARDWWSQ